MATGRLGNGQLTASTWVNCYDVPTGKIASFSILITNRSGGSITVSIAISNSTSSPANSEYIENNVTIAPDGIFERTGLVASDYEYVLINSSATLTSYRIHGYEENP